VKARDLIDPAECVRCGACCVADHSGTDYVHLEPEDIEQLTERDLRLLVVGPRERSGGEWIQFRALRTKHDRRGNCRCKALRGTIGTKVSCSIYERRPLVCRLFIPGGPLCLAARRENRPNGVKG
jgi:Fe-S-cluster containining protein